METIEQKIADEYLDNLILNTINTIWKNRKRPYGSSIYEYLHKELNNYDVNAEIIESRLSFLIANNRIENITKDQTFLYGHIQPNISDKSLSLTCETPLVVKIRLKQILENANVLLVGKIASLEENVSVFTQN